MSKADDILAVWKKLNNATTSQKPKFVVYDKKTFIKLGGTEEDWQQYLKEKNND